MIYLLYGEDEYLRNEYLKKIKKTFGEIQLGINYVQVDENNVSNIISDIETPAFGFPTKLIIAKDTGLFKKKNAFSEKLAECLKENANNLEDVVLVFAEQEVEKNKLFNTIKEVGQALEFKEQNMSQLIKKVKSLANAYKVEIKENVDYNKEIMTKFSIQKYTDMFYQIKDVVNFEENSFYIIKTNEYKNWHPAMANIDLDTVIEELLSENGGDC